MGYCNTSNEDYYCKALDRLMDYDIVEGGFDILGKPTDCPLRAESEDEGSMTRGEAYNRIDAIIAKHEIDDEYVTVTNFKDYDALRIARKLLEQEPCDDCIRREDALMALTGEWTEPTDELIHRFIRRIKNLPSVTLTEKVGRWEYVQYDGNPNIGNWHCSECRSIFIEGVIKREKDSIPFYKYCPQCGAKMKEGD